MGHTKRNLFLNHISDEDSQSETPDDAITSNGGEERYPSVKSDDEYIPDSATSDSETDSDSFLKKDKIKIVAADKNIKQVNIQEKVREHVCNVIRMFFISKYYS